MLHSHLACAALVGVASLSNHPANFQTLAHGMPLAIAKPESEGADPTLVAGSLRIDRGEGHVPIWVPPSEELTYDVRIDIGFLGSVGVGKVTLSSGVEEYRSGLPLPGGAPASAGKKSAWVRSYAAGGHLGYHLQHELIARILPQAWPRIVYQDTQTGSESRRRELKLGLRGEEHESSYRHDGHCSGCDRREHFVSSALPWGSPHHCEGCKRGEHRIWRESRSRPVPSDTVDMLSAVYLARTFLREGWAETSFPVLDKERLWTLTLSRGSIREVESAAGNYLCTEILLRTSKPPGEAEDDEEFSGLFGIKGDLHIWMESGTGVPIVIQGDLPVGGIMVLGIDVRLASQRGTPLAFRPVEKR